MLIVPDRADHDVIKLPKPVDRGLIPNDGRDFHTAFAQRFGADQAIGGQIRK